MATVPNYYEMLDIPVDADDVTIKNAFRNAAKSVGNDTERRDQLKEAYEILTSPNKRSSYDAQLVRQAGLGKSAGANGAHDAWEYLTLKSSRNYGTTKYYINDEQQKELKDARFSDVINMIGEDGWEMVGISAVGNEQIYIFKRAGA
jgi:DnaJ-class molecular chaperone